LYVCHWCSLFCSCATPISLFLYATGICVCYWQVLERPSGGQLHTQIHSSEYAQIVILGWHGNKAATFKWTHVFSCYNICVQNTSIQDNDTPVLISLVIILTKPEMSISTSIASCSSQIFIFSVIKYEIMLTICEYAYKNTTEQKSKEKSSDSLWRIY
jgi:hypothetical protein